MSESQPFWRQNKNDKNYMTTSTYERWKKRQLRKANDFNRGLEERSRKNADSLANAKKSDVSRRKIFRNISDQVKKQHPEMTTVQARNFARKTPLGRKFWRLYHQGYDAAYIKKSLGYRGGKFKSTTGSKGG